MPTTSLFPWPSSFPSPMTSGAHRRGALSPGHKIRIVPLRTTDLGIIPAQSLANSINLMLGMQLLEVDDRPQAAKVGTGYPHIQWDSVLRIAKSRRSAGNPVILYSVGPIQSLNDRWWIQIGERTGIVASDSPLESPPESHERQSFWLRALLIFVLRLITSRECPERNCVLGIGQDAVDTRLEGSLCDTCVEAFASDSSLVKLDRVVEALDATEYVLSKGLDVRSIDDWVGLDYLSFREDRALLFDDRTQSAWAKDNLGVAADDATQLFRKLTDDAEALGGWSASMSRIVKASNAVDALLYLTKKRHRDHSRHQFHLAVAGLRFMECRLASTGRTLAEQMMDTFNSRHRLAFGRSYPFTVEQLRLFWGLAALIHDTGYPLAELVRARDALGAHPQGEEAARLIESLLRDYEDLFSQACLDFLLMPRGLSAHDQWLNSCARLADFLGDVRTVAGDIVWRVFPSMDCFDGGGVNHGILSG